MLQGRFNVIHHSQHTVVLCGCFRATPDRDHANNPQSGPLKIALSLEQLWDDLLIQQMEGHDEILSRVMTDKQVRAPAQEHLAREVYARARALARAREVATSVAGNELSA